MFFIVGLGLGDPNDISVKGLDIVKNADKVYLENYTSILTAGKDVLERFYGREIVLADREMIELLADNILVEAQTKQVVLLVVGDPFSATTHTDLVLRASKLNIPCKIIHNASIVNAVSCCGLQLYNFGETVSIPFWTESWQPDSFYEKICNNKSRGLHTLCLLGLRTLKMVDNLGAEGLKLQNSWIGEYIRVREQTIESLTKKKKEYEPPRFMSVSEAASQLLQIISRRENHTSELSSNTECVGLARVGTSDQQMCHGKLSSFFNVDLGPPLHSLVIIGDLHPLEQEFLLHFAKTIN